MYSDLDKTYLQIFNDKPEILVHSPGRINLIGEHTDYYKGYVLPAAIDRYMFFAMGRNKSADQIRIVASDINDEICISMNCLEISEKGWANFFIGIVKQLLHQGREMSGVDIVFGGNIPIGGGLSSSSALECGFLKGIDRLFGWGLNHLEMIEISKKSNHQFLGLQGGIMDQYSILFGKKDHAMLLNCDTIIHEDVPIHLGEYSLLLFDSKVSHELVSSEYNNRVSEGKSALAKINTIYPEIKFLSEMTLNLIEDIMHLLTDEELKRVRHVVSENERVTAFCEAMRNNEYKAMGELLFASHKSLKEDYEVSCEEMDLLVGFAEENMHILGARMMGGGFGGCTLNIVRTDQVEKVKNDLLHAYQEGTGIKGETYKIDVVDGVSVNVLSRNS